MDSLSTRQASIREVIKLASPIIVSMLSISILGLVDTWFMGWIGPNAQAAVGIGAPTIFSVLSLFLGIISGLTTFVSQYYGAKNYHSCGKMLWHTLFMAFVLGILCALFLNPLVWKALVWMKVNPEFIQETFDYIRIRIFAAPYIFISYSLLSFLRGLGDMKTPAIASCVVVASNIPLTYIFTFGWQFIPAFGVSGAAIGTIIAQFIEMILYSIVVFNHNNHQKFLTRKVVIPKLKTYCEYLKLSVPIGLSWAVEHIGWIVFGFYIGRLSKEEAAANSIVQAFMNVAFMPGLAISIAATTLVGQYTGAKNIKSAEKSAYYSMFLAIGCLVSLGLLFMILRYPISRFYSDDEAVVEIAANVFIIGAVYQVFDAMGATTAGALRGAGDTRAPMLIQIISMWMIMIPLVFWLGGLYGLYGAWIASSVAIVVMGLCYFIRFKQGKWKTMAV